jgi:hypothetical protein
VRLLQVVLACTVLWLSSGVAAAAPRVIDGIVLVASATVTGAGARAGVSASSDRRPVTHAASGPSLVRPVPASAAPVREPARTTKRLVLVRYKFLRNCTLLR